MGVLSAFHFGLHIWCSGVFAFWFRHFSISPHLHGVQVFVHFAGGISVLHFIFTCFYTWAFLDQVSLCQSEGFKRYCITPFSILANNFIVNSAGTCRSEFHCEQCHIYRSECFFYSKPVAVNIKVTVLVNIGVNFIVHFTGWLFQPIKLYSAYKKANTGAMHLYN